MTKARRLVAWDDTYVSTGHLPPDKQVAEFVAEAHARFASNDEGEVSRVYPALEVMPKDLFGVSMIDTVGDAFEAGDTRTEFTIMSVSKPFVFALICDRLGATEVREKVGMNATGLAFNSLAGIERAAGGLTNPMVNAGAIASTSLAGGDTLEQRWQFILEGLSRFAGRELSVNDEVYESASETNFRNRSIVWMLHGFGRVYCDPLEALDLYTKQCSLDVSAHDLAVMGATLADGGLNPVTRDQVISPETCHYALAAMLTAGMYETSGDWLYEVGLPGKSGIGGGIVTVSPGKGGLGTFAPPLDAAGNSVKGQLATRYLSQRLGLDLLLSTPVRDRATTAHEGGV